VCRSVGGIALKQLLFVALGGAAGSSLRYLLCLLTPRCVPGSQVPLGVMAVNIVGALLIGWMAGGSSLPAHWRHVLIVGFLGGFTTFSAFSWDTATLATSGHLRCALVNVLLTVTLTVLAVLAGLKLRAAA
jgi:fluoride exporter